MASLFLSYDHQDAARAAPIAQALERAGHAVWWDRNIHGGAEYNDEIEGALNRADAILVLWSKRSVKSPWVRDEAAVGRDRGRLIPVLLDKTDPPLGFRQFQNINLSSRPARQRTGELEELMAAIARLEGAPTAEHRSSDVVFRPRLGSGSRWPMIAAMVAAVVLITAFAGWRLVHRNAVPIVAVAAADSSSTSQALARDLLVKLGTLQASDAQALQLASQDGGGRHSSLVFSVAARTAGRAPEASLALFDGKQQMLLWSADITRSSGSLADLKQQLAYTAAQVLKCATEGLSSTGRRLDQVTLKIYLSGCAAAADTSEANSQDLLRTFLQVTRRAPDFAGG